MRNKCPVSVCQLPNLRFVSGQGRSSGLFRGIIWRGRRTGTQPNYQARASYLQRIHIQAVHEVRVQCRGGSIMLCMHTLCPIKRIRRVNRFFSGERFNSMCYSLINTIHTFLKWTIQKFF